jgi:hypothetical protein
LSNSKISAQALRSIALDLSSNSSFSAQFLSADMNSVAAAFTYHLMATACILASRNEPLAFVEKSIVESILLFLEACNCGKPYKVVASDTVRSAIDCLATYGPYLSTTLARNLVKAALQASVTISNVLPKGDSQQSLNLIKHVLLYCMCE